MYRRMHQPMQPAWVVVGAGLLQAVALDVDVDLDVALRNLGPMEAGAGCGRRWSAGTTAAAVHCLRVESSRVESGA